MGGARHFSGNEYLCCKGESPLVLGRKYMYFYFERKSLPVKNESLHCSFRIDSDVFEKNFLHLEGRGAPCWEEIDLHVLEGISKRFSQR